MIKLLRYLIAPLAMLLLVPGALDAAELSTPSGPVVLTVAGAISNTNRPPFDAGEDAFLGYHEKSFDKAAAFDRAMLEALGMHEITAKADSWPKGHRFEGPWLKDVLAAAGAEGSTVMVFALDGYGVELTPDELASQDWMLALKRDGQYLGLGQKGPAWITYERADGKDAIADEEAKWVWTVFYIEAL